MPELMGIRSGGRPSLLETQWSGSRGAALVGGAGTAAGVATGQMGSSAGRIVLVVVEVVLVVVVVRVVVVAVVVVVVVEVTAETRLAGFSRSCDGGRGGREGMLLEKLKDSC